MGEWCNGSHAGPKRRCLATCGFKSHLAHVADRALLRIPVRPLPGEEQGRHSGGSKDPGNAPPWLSWQSAGFWFRRVKFESLRGNGSRRIALGMALTPGRVPVRIRNGGSTIGVWGNWQPARFWSWSSRFESWYLSELENAGSNPARRERSQR
jgi:hypothetical protein